MSEFAVTTFSTEQTFIAIKPDAVQRGYSGTIIQRFEQKGLKLVALKLMMVSRELAENHYAEHVGKLFFESLVSFITSGPIVAMVWQGPNAVVTARKLMGATKPNEAEPGTIRFDYGLVMERNIIHGSDSTTSAEREIGLFFEPHEVLTHWDRCSDKWLVKQD
jgi:nucleoside-diphosphate kinase